MKSKAVLALVLSVVLITTACSVDQVLTDINLLIQTAGSIGTAVGAVSPADAAIVAGLTAVASTGLTAIQNAYDTYKKSGAQSDLQKVDAAVAAVQTNLPAELAAAHVYDPAAKAKCQAWVNLTVTTLQAVTELLPELQTASGPSAKRAVLAQAAARPNLSPETIQWRWNKEVCGGEAKCSKLVKSHARTGFWQGLGNAFGEAKWGG